MSNLMDKIGALLLKAERSDNEHEQDAFMQKAQQLATLASIDLEAARIRQQTKELRETPIVKQVEVFSRGDRSKTKAYFLELFWRIAAVNDVKSNLSQENTYIILYGYPSDIEVSEALFNTLSVQMVNSAEKWLATKEYRNETMEYEVTRTFINQWGYRDRRTVLETKPVDGRTARRSFYAAFTARVVARLRDAKNEAVETYQSAETVDSGEMSAALVLKSKQDSVAGFYSEKSNARGSWRGNASGGGSSSGRNAGRSAGDSARLSGGARIGGKTPISS